MTKVKIEPDRILTNFLRANLTDINSSRSGQWIYPDFPRIQDLGNNSFPRIGITILDEFSAMMGLSDFTQFHTITFQIDVVAKKDEVYTLTVTDEAMGTVSSTFNSNRLTYDYVPSTVTNIKHDGTEYGTVTMKNTNGDFSTPAGMAGDLIEWSFSTGDLNLNSIDVTADDGEAITSTYTVALEGKKAVQHLARRVWKQIRNNPRDLDLNGLFAPSLISINPIPLDEELGIYRQTLEVRFNAFNIGEGL